MGEGRTERILFTETYTAGEAMANVSRILKYSTAANDTVLLATGGSPERYAGMMLQEKTHASGDKDIPVLRYGRGKVKLGDTVARGDRLRASTAGVAITIGAHYTGDMIGIARKSGVVGDIIDIDIRIQQVFDGNVAETVLYNVFQSPAPGTDWTSGADGEELAASKSDKITRIPLTNLRVGDVINSFAVKGRVSSAGNAVTIDAKLVKTSTAGANTDIAGGGITQISKTANYTFAVGDATTLSAAETIATGFQYYVEIDGTTAADTQAFFNGIEVNQDND